MGGIGVLSNILSSAEVVSAWGEDSDSDDDGSDDDTSDDMHQLWLLILNLLYKAVKYTSAGTHHVLEVSCIARAQVLQMYASDSQHCAPPPPPPRGGACIQVQQ